MKFFLKITISLLLLCCILWIICWIYISDSITKTLNQHYANRNICYNSYLGKRCFKFSRAVKSGFPTQISTQLIQFEENLIQEHALYKNPVSIIYNITKSKLALNYEGEILSKSKITNKDDLLIDIENFKIEFGTKNIINFFQEIIKSHKNYNKDVKTSNTEFEKQNNITSIIHNIMKFNISQKKSNNILNFNIKSSTKNLSIFRLSDKQKIFHKNKDHLKIKLLCNLKQIKKYLFNKNDSHDQIISIPNIDLSYKTEIQNISNKDTDLPKILTLFPFVLSQPNTKGKINVFIDQMNSEKNIESKVKIYSNITNNFMNLDDLKIQYSNQKDQNTLKEKIKSKGKIFIKTGAIDKLHKLYNKILIEYEMVKILDKHHIANTIHKIFKNKKHFHLENIENKSYDIKLKGNMHQNLNIGNNDIIKEIEYFAIHSEETGFTISLKPHINTKLHNQLLHQITGQVTFNNYPLLIEYFAPSIIEVISQIQHNEHLKTPYHIDALKLFCKMISKKSNEKDISLDYSFNSEEQKKFKLEGKKMDKLAKMYHLSLLKILQQEKGNNIDDLLAILQKILPNSIQNKEQLLQLMQYKIN